MAKWMMHGLDDYVAYLQKLGKNTNEAVDEAVYEMAKVVADNIRENIQSLPTVSNRANIATYRKGYSRLSDEEKQGLLDGFGISPMQNDNGYVHVKLGFDGYNDVKTKKYPKGQPNALIARVTESGSSYRQKTPFIRPAVEKSKNTALEAARVAIDKKIYSVTPNK